MADLLYWFSAAVFFVFASCLCFRRAAGAQRLVGTLAWAALLVLTAGLSAYHIILILVTIS